MKLRPLIIFLLAFGASASCMKKPNLRDDDGESFSSANLEDALSGAWGETDPLTMQQNEFSYTEKSMQIADLPARVTLQDAKTIVLVEDEADKKIFTIGQQTAEVTDGVSSKPFSTQRKINVKKSNASIMEIRNLTRNAIYAAAVGADSTTSVVPLEAVSALPLGIELVGGLMSACERADDWDVECFNLRQWTSVEPAPRDLASQANCGGIPNCTLKKRNVAFDLVINSTDPDSQTKVRNKVIYTVKVAPDAPFMSRVTDFCYQGIGTAQNVKFPVTVCQTIRNFTPGR